MNLIIDVVVGLYLIREGMISQNRDGTAENTKPSARFIVTGRCSTYGDPI